MKKNDPWNSHCGDLVILVNRFEDHAADSFDRVVDFFLVLKLLGSK